VSLNVVIGVVYLAEDEVFEDIIALFKVDDIMSVTGIVIDDVFVSVGEDNITGAADDIFVSIDVVDGLVDRGVEDIIVIVSICVDDITVFNVDEDFVDKTVGDVIISIGVDDIVDKTVGDVIVLIGVDDFKVLIRVDDILFVDEV
jgi:hypothetical protein